ALSIFISNPLLVSRTDDLQTLEQNHQRLSQDYELILGSQQLYKEELSDLATSLSGLEFEKTQLQEENLRIGELNENLDRRIIELNTSFEQSLLSLEEQLGLPMTGEITEERVEFLQATANQRLYFLHNIPNGVPIQAIRISDRFGPRIHPVKKTRQMHQGIDFKAHTGTPVYATADGIAEYAAYHKQSGYGNLIILQHNFGFKTYYGHLDKVAIQPSQFVQKGDLIGYSGNTGVSTGPHLHYEVKHLYTPLDPEPFLAWNMTDFDSLFEKVKDVKWASLRNLYPLNQADIQLAQPSSQKEINSAAR
ncbi:MAG: peptidoglycan DD-metalloendopeptidase family protein, partial [Pontibacterium sp.]